MILNRQRSIRIPIRSLNRFFARALRRLRLPPGSVAIALVTNAEIARWNRAYRHKPRPTDVLSFPVSDSPASSGSRKVLRRSTRRFSPTTFAPPSTSSSYLGDLAIAPSVARQNARRFSRTFTQEMQILILHGILHLMGYDHETDTGQMDRIEQRLRREFGLS
jgi:probable rRNA maturation factor